MTNIGAISRPIPNGCYTGWIVRIQEATAWGGQSYATVTLFLNKAVGTRQPQVFGVRCRFRVWEGSEQEGITRFLDGLKKASALRPDGRLDREQLMGMYVAGEVCLKEDKATRRYVIVEKLAPATL